MEQNNGASLSATGLSPTVEPASSLAGSAASIPSAEVLAARLVDPEFCRQQAFDKLATKLGYLLRWCRICSGLTVDELAAKIGRDRRVVLKVERGEYKDGLREIGLLSWALNVELEFRVEPRASAIEARSDETPQADQPEGRERDPKGDAQGARSMSARVDRGE